MEFPSIDIVTRFLLPPLLGGAGGLLGVWLNWGIEKKRHRLQHRRELVNSWRLNLLPMIGQVQNPPTIWAGDRQRAAMASPHYASLRPHLSPAAIKEIEDPMVKLLINTGKGGAADDWSYHYPLKTFLKEIERIERKWKLV